MEAIKAEEFSPGGESLLLTLHILDEVRGDTEMKKGHLFKTLISIDLFSQ